MKKIVRFVSIFMLFCMWASPARSADETTFMERIKADTAIITEATERIKKDKHDVEAFYARGSAHFNLGQVYIIMYGPAYTAENNKTIKDEFEAAVTDFTEVIDEKPDILQAYIMRGMAYGQMGLSAAAVADFSHVIEVDPKNSFAYYARGREYWARGDFLKAKEDYDKAVDLDDQWKDNFYK